MGRIGRMGPIQATGLKIKFRAVRLREGERERGPDKVGAGED